MQVVILAGGKGTRIASVAHDIPKPMIPVAGKPVLEWQIELARRYGFRDFLLMTGYLGDCIESYFGDGSRWGVHIDYYREPEPLGTAGALQRVRARLEDEFWVFYGDTVMDFDMEAMLAFHHAHRADATLFLHPNDHPYDSDLVRIGEDSLVTAFLPKPRPEGEAQRNLVNAALYILRKDCLDYLNGGKADFGRDIFAPMLSDGKRIAGYVSAEYIKDMGTPERWEAVGRDLQIGKVARLNRRNPRPCIFLDRDGVLNREVNLLSRPEQLELLPGAAQAVRAINQSGYLAVVVTNQPQIARNLCSIEELRSIHDRLETLLGAEGAYLDAIYYCPHHPDKGYPEERPEYKIDCDCRKPKPGMLLQAAQDLNIDLSASYMIGDSPRDVGAGEAAGVKQSFQIETNQPGALQELVELLLSA